MNKMRAMEKFLVNNGKLRFGALFLLALLIQGCAKTYYPYVSDVPPVAPFIPTENKLSYVNVPPAVIPGSVMYTRHFSSQYFKIGVLPCKDNTGEQRGADYKASIAEQINTALEDTKRFTLLDRGEFTDIDKVYLKDVIRQGNSTDSIRETRDSGVTSILYRRYMESDQNDRILMESLKSKCDGFLATTITSVMPSPENPKMFVVGVECKIVSTNASDDKTILYAHSHDIRFFTDKASGGIRANRDDVNKIATTIKESFPNPDLQDSLHIIGISEKTIKVNIGKANNIQKGMIGFVVKMSNSTNSYDFRARFLVTEVYQNAFAAVLLVEPGHEPEDKVIISQIKVGEPVRME